MCTSRVFIVSTRRTLILEPEKFHRSDLNVYRVSQNHWIFFRQQIFLINLELNFFLTKTSREKMSNYAIFQTSYARNKFQIKSPEGETPPEIAILIFTYDFLFKVCEEAFFTIARYNFENRWCLDVLAKTHFQIGTKIYYREDISWFWDICIRVQNTLYFKCLYI